MIQPPPARMLLKKRGPRPGDKPDREPDNWAETLDKEPDILCALCGWPITADSERITQGGAHEHTFFNPAGLVYEIACFGSAPGCVVHGPPSSEFTWFPGYAWQVAICGRCTSHLGWRFLGRGRVFHGLIKDRLTQKKPTPSPKP